MLSVSQIIISLVSFFWAKKKYKIDILYVSFMRCMEILWKEKSVYITIMLTSLYIAVNVIVLGFFENKAEIGFFTAGQKLIIVAQTVITLPLSQVFYPIISKSFSESKGKGVYQVQRLVPIVLLFTGMLGAFLLLFGPRILLLFYGASFYPATSSFMVLAFIPLFIAFNNIMGIQVMLNYNMDFLYLKIILIGTVFSLLGNLILVQLWGTIGTSINWVLTEIFIAIMLYISVRKKGINIFNGDFFKFNFIYGEISGFLIRANPNRKS
jgi:PST family polysaccharide transporter